MDFVLWWLRILFIGMLEDVKRHYYIPCHHDMQIHLSPWNCGLDGIFVENAVKLAKIIDENAVKLAKIIDEIALKLAKIIDENAEN